MIICLHKFPTPNIFSVESSPKYGKNKKNNIDEYLSMPDYQ